VGSGIVDRQKLLSNKTKQKMANYFIGVDVSKKKIDNALLRDGVILSKHVVENTSACIEDFLTPYVKQFQLAGDEVWVCMEHTGVYNYPLLKVLEKLGVKACVEPPMQIKKSQGMVRGKTDAVDAVRIAQYAYKNRETLKAWKPQRGALQKIKALLSQRARLVRAKVQLQVPVEECEGFSDASIAKALASSIKNSIRGIEKDLGAIEAKIQETVKADEQLSVQFTRATSVVGIGPVTALNMMVETGGFELIKNPKSFACHAGVAPFEKSSGEMKGRARVSKMANMNLKKLLHLAALSAIQHSLEIKQYYERKVAEGKNRMSVINAVRNKLIKRVFACINQERTYEKNYKPALA
jgi:transposase